MNVRFRVGFLSAFVLMSCVSRTFSEARDVNVEWSDKDYPGDETILIQGVKGELALARTAPRWSLQVIRPGGPQELRQVPTAKSFRGRFFLLNLGLPESYFEVIDPAAPERVERIALPQQVFSESQLPQDLGRDRYWSDFVMLPNGNLLLAVPGSTVVHRFDPQSGFAPLVDLASAVSGKIALRSMLFQDGLLFVGVHRHDGTGRAIEGATAVVDVATAQVRKVVPLNGVRPEIPMDYDKVRKKLWVVSAGNQNADDGAINRIDADPASPRFLTVDYTTKNAAFEGPVILGRDFRSVFVAEHTATPTRSTHIHHNLFGPSGTLDDLRNGPTGGIDLTSAFEGNDGLQANDSRDLAAISFNCRFAGCPRGGGLYLFDGATGMPFRKLYTQGKVPPEISPAPEVTIPFFVTGFSFLHRE